MEFETGMFGYQVNKGWNWMINLHWHLMWIQNHLGDTPWMCLQGNFQKSSNEERGLTLTLGNTTADRGLELMEKNEEIVGRIPHVCVT